MTFEPQELERQSRVLKTDSSLVSQKKFSQRFHRAAGAQGPVTWDKMT